ncbi:MULTISPECIES: hypothetical protein [unclassified Mycoplasma]|uniref:hypothetical protein n=1 Tax=unclassified Mycoplasma TaxID=2683645 RepID=UPI00211CAAE2|nr:MULTISPECIES: hypothetical protein [unclassified Mycoplasma]UUM19787.1 hypothetical protein NPA11_03410 [Mycoplasma sp. 1578d]UUM24771.1 hypothetical protein NPA12_03700 [Mycoplasma sp. 3686d]
MNNIQQKLSRAKKFAIPLLILPISLFLLLIIMIFITGALAIGGAYGSIGIGIILTFILIIMLMITFVLLGVFFIVFISQIKNYYIEKQDNQQIGKYNIIFIISIISVVIFPFLIILILIPIVWLIFLIIFAILQTAFIIWVLITIGESQRLLFQQTE